MIAEPRWFYDGSTKTMVINLVNITSTGRLSKAGVGTVQMSLGDSQFQKSDVLDTIPLVPPILLEYTPDPVQDYSIAWNNYFTNPSLGMTLVSGTPGTGTMLKYQLPDTTTLVIKQYEVNIKSL